MKKSIIVTNQIKGFHKYSNAPEDVAFLRSVHRHVFQIKTTIQVFHNDRDLEFFQLQNFIDSCIRKQFKSDSFYDYIFIESCESLAEFVLLELKNKYPERTAKVEVWEDGENGCSVEEA